MHEIQVIDDPSAATVLARNDLSERITATPAHADHKLDIRTAKHLWAFGQ